MLILTIKDKEKDYSFEDTEKKFIGKICIDRTMASELLSKADIIILGKGMLTIKHSDAYKIIDGSKKICLYGSNRFRVTVTKTEFKIILNIYIGRESALTEDTQDVMREIIEYIYTHKDTKNLWEVVKTESGTFTKIKIY